MIVGRGAERLAPETVRIECVVFGWRYFEMAKGFTAEELAEMALWDAEIDASDEEDWELNDLIESLMNDPTEDEKLRARKHEEYERRKANMSSEKKAEKKERAAQYREENRQKLRASSNAWYEKNKEAIAARRKAKRDAAKAAQTA